MDSGGGDGAIYFSQQGVTRNSYNESIVCRGRWLHHWIQAQGHGIATGERAIPANAAMRS
jgi:hypothetical protein